MPPSIFILFLMALVLLSFNLSAEDCSRSKTQRWPAWMVGVQVRQPLLRLVILLRQLTTWLLCRTPRIDVSALTGLASWMFAVALALGLASSIPEAVPGLLPFLLWTPVETWVSRRPWIR